MRSTHPWPPPNAEYARLVAAVQETVTLLSAQGRLLQVEYAGEAVKQVRLRPPTHARPLSLSRSLACGPRRSKNVPTLFLPLPRFSFFTRTLPASLATRFVCRSFALSLFVSSALFL